MPVMAFVISFRVFSTSLASCVLVSESTYFLRDNIEACTCRALHTLDLEWKLLYTISVSCVEAFSIALTIAVGAFRRLSGGSGGFLIAPKTFSRSWIFATTSPMRLSISPNFWSTALTLFSLFFWLSMATSRSYPTSTGSSPSATAGSPQPLSGAWGRSLPFSELLCIVLVDPEFISDLADLASSGASGST